MEHRLTEPLYSRIAQGIKIALGRGGEVTMNYINHYTGLAMAKGKKKGKGGGKKRY